MNINSTNSWAQQRKRILEIFDIFCMRFFRQIQKLFVRGIFYCVLSRSYAKYNLYHRRITFGEFVHQLCNSDWYKLNTRNQNTLENTNEMRTNSIVFHKPTSSCANVLMKCHNNCAFVCVITGTFK